MKTYRSLAVVGLTVALGGCAMDDEFFDNLATASETLATELENRPVCTWTQRYGQVCQPAYTLQPQPYGTGPGYINPAYDPALRDWRREQRREERRDRREKRREQARDRDHD